jgi:hypothetical protein
VNGQMIFTVQYSSDRASQFQEIEKIEI